MVVALSLFESRRLLLSPLLWVGAGITLFLLFGVNWARDNRYNLFTTALGGLAATTLLCLNLAALRPRRHRAEELYVTQPASRSLSTAGLLVAGIAPAVLGAVLLAVGYVVEDAGSGLALWAPGYGESPRGAIATLHEVARTPTFPELAQGPLAIVVLGALGVALARWLPRAKLAPLWVFFFLAGELTLTGWNLTEAPAHLFMPFTDVAVATRGAEWPCSAGTPCGFDRFVVGSAWWHLLYLAGLVAAFAGAALWRDRPGRRSALLGLGGLTVAVFAGVLQVP
jgi:Ca2+/Na+ antiporter